MGLAQSSNIVNNTTDIISKVATNIVSDVVVHGAQSQDITISGNANVSGNTFSQTLDVNSSGLMKAVINQQSSQDLTQQIKQSAASIVSGVNAFQFSKAYNQLNNYVRAVSQVTADVSQTCTVGGSQTQSITITGTAEDKAPTQVTNNVFEQVQKIVSTCVADVSSKNSNMQSVKQDMGQTATAKSIGFSIWAIIIGILIVLMAPVFIAEYVGYVGMKFVIRFVFPLLLIAGGIMIAVAMSRESTTMDTTAFSKGISNSESCSNTPMDISGKFTKLADVANACLKDKKCKAFDYLPDSADAEKTSKEVAFYSDVSPFPCKDLIKDDINIIHSTRIGAGRGQPPRTGIVTDPNTDKSKRVPDYQAQPGDAFITIDDLHWWTWNGVNKELPWIDNGMIVEKKWTSAIWPLVTISTTDPNVQCPKTCPGKGFSQVYIWLESPLSLKVYYSQFNKWVQMEAKSRPAGFTFVKPKQDTFSGFKIHRFDTILYWVGVILASIGGLGSFFMLIQYIFGGKSAGGSGGGVKVSKAPKA
jgi:uncharacterized integral membrane protein